MREDTDLTKAMEPILLLSGDEGVFELEAGEEPQTLSEQEYEAALANLPSAVYDVQQYWKDHPPEAPFTPHPQPAITKRRGVPRRRGGQTVH